MKSNRTFSRFRALGILAWSLAALPALAANQLEFFFPVANGPTVEDDRAVAKPIFWGGDSQPIRWVIYKSATGTVMIPAVNSPPLGFNVQDNDIKAAISRALHEWDSIGFGHPGIDDYAQFTSDFPFETTPFSRDPKLDMRNTISFRGADGLGDDVLAVTSIFFMEADYDVVDAMHVPEDQVESGIGVLVDVNEDGFVDFQLQPRSYSQGEILDSDISFNPATSFRLWPEDRDDVPSEDRADIIGSPDIEAIAVHELGHSLGLGHSWITKATMTPFLRSQGFLFPTDPYEFRNLEYDDELASGLLYGASNGSGKGEIRGKVRDGRFVSGTAGEFIDEPVVQAPVFLGIPAPDDEAHPDNVLANDGKIRMIAQVLSGQDLRLGLGPETSLADIEPAGFADNADTILLGIVNGLNAEFDSNYRFPGLAPRSDYVVYIDPIITGHNEVTDTDPGNIAINDVYAFFTDGNSVESYPREFYGGPPEGTSPADTFDDTDDPFGIKYIEVAAGTVTPDIDFITNLAETPDEPTGLDNTGPGGLRFVLDTAGFPSSGYVPLGGDLADLNGDGFLDVGVAVFQAGADAGLGPLNRIYANVAKTGGTTANSRVFQDVTFGKDGVPGTGDDILPVHSDASRDLKFGDFNGDGRPDLFVSNQGQNRLYVNIPFDDPDPRFNFRFMDYTPFGLQGVFNLGGRFANSSGVALGDLDCDGDLDIVTSLLDPLTDLAGTEAIIDADPANDDFPDGDNVYDIENDPITSGPPYTDSNRNSGPLFVGERILINRRPSELRPGDTHLLPGILPTIQAFGFCFVDETFGLDPNVSEQVFGDPNNVVVSRPIPGDDDDIPFAVSNFASVLHFSDGTDRMPPLYPGVNQLDPAETPPAVTNATVSPMSTFSIMPRLGPITKDGGLDLVSVKAFGTDPVGSLGQSGFYQNIDVGIRLPDGSIKFGDPNLDPPADPDLINPLIPTLDGIPDGYFVCINYGTDYHFRDGSGLFPIRHRGTPEQVLDQEPLLIGIADGDPAADADQTDIFTRVESGAFAGVIGDWQYRGAPKPMIFHDYPDTNAASMASLYRPTVGTNGESFDAGAVRPLSLIPEELLTGRALSFELQEPGQVTLYPAIGGNTTVTSVSPVPFAPNPIPGTPQTRGEVHGVAAADFDNDGDLDVATAESLLEGFNLLGIPRLLSTPSTNRVFLNQDDATTPAADTEGMGSMLFFKEEDTDRNGDGVVTNSGSFTPNTARISFAVLAGDIDNDGDQDIIELNALNSNQLFVNRLIDAPPDLVDTTDAPLFEDQTFRYIPPAFSGALVPPFGSDIFTGITTAVAAADLTGDGKPDLIQAEGGSYSGGDYPLVLLNVGNVRTDAAQGFKPIQAPYPLGRLKAPGFASINGYFTDDVRGPGSYFDVSATDFNGDGGADLLFTRKGDGLVLYLNNDTNDPAFNSIPDPDSKPDGVFTNASGLMPNGGALVDPGHSPLEPFQLKRQSRRLAIGNFDGDAGRRPDIFVANGIDGSGAPNALLLQTGFGTFNDVTETNLPTGTIAVDNSWGAVAGDFDHDGDIDIIVINEPNATSTGCRYLVNNGSGHFTDVFDRLPTSLTTGLTKKPRYIVKADFDGIGEAGEDKNGNGIIDQGENGLAFTNKPTEVFEDLNCNGSLDPGEDLNGNGMLDASEDLNNNGILDTEDTNGNHMLDLGEDLNLNGILDFEDTNANSIIEGGDKNGDGELTCRLSNIWEASWDLFITFDDRSSMLLINGATHNNPGVFTDESATRLPDLPDDANSAGARAGDVNGDGFPDIVVAKQFGGTSPVQLFINDGAGIFADATHEIPYPASTLGQLPVDAMDVELLDVDGDGDLDLFVGTTSIATSLVNTGGLELLYINRSIGKNQNADAPRITGSLPAIPLAIATYPPYGIRGQSQEVEVTGVHFDSDATVDFGAGVSVLNVQHVNSQKLMVQISVSPAATVGGRQINVVNTGSGQSSVSSPDIFSVVTNAPGNSVGEDLWARYR